MTNIPPTRIGRGYYALGADFVVTLPGGAGAAAKGIPDWLAFLGVLAVAGGAAYLGTWIGANLASDREPVLLRVSKR